MSLWSDKQQDFHYTRRTTQKFLNIPRYKSVNYGKNTIIYKTAKLWNNFLTENKNINNYSKGMVKRTFKFNTINNYC